MKPQLESSESSKDCVTGIIDIVLFKALHNIWSMNAPPPPRNKWELNITNIQACLHAQPMNLGKNDTQTFVIFFPEDMLHNS